ncbi:iron ABC transporter [Sulfolobales archaeon HS-7]|nr:iron ABC transporter [Sulfolobales archaeon HS-7]
MKVLLFLALLVASIMLFFLLGPVYTLPPFTPLDIKIAVYIKLPSELFACIAGALLAVSGLILQYLFRNPLMDPYVSGTSAGASFGAVVSFLLPFELIASVMYETLTAFLFALLASVITLLLGRKGTVNALLFAGLTVNFAFVSGLMIAEEYLALKFPSTPSPLFWIFGEIGVESYKQVVILLLITLGFIAFAISSERRFDLISAGDELSSSFGLNSSAFRIVWFMVTSIVIAYLVSQVGIIGFIGLMAPHIARNSGADGFRESLIYSALIGASLLGLANVIAGGTFGFILPMTSVTAIIAMPILIRLVRTLD